MDIEVKSLIHEIFIAPVHGKNLMLYTTWGIKISDTVKSEVYTYRDKTSI